MATDRIQTETAGDGPPLVLVPGGLTGWASWLPFVEPFSRERRVTRTQLLAVDRGLRNEPVPPDYSVAMESAALAAGLEGVHSGPLDFAAWSFGALVTLDFALDHPERVRRLILIEPPAIWVLRGRGPIAPELEEQRRALRAMGPGGISEEQLEWFTHFAGFVPRDVDPRTLPMWPSWMLHRQSLRTQDAPFRHEDSLERVRRFERPVLLFKGVGSAGFLREIVQILSEELPHARVVEMTGGHAPHLANPERFVETAREFLAD